MRFRFSVTSMALLLFALNLLVGVGTAFAGDLGPWPP
jgi:hypothetical protein